MGIYLNPEPDKFIEAINSPIYVDKSELICFTNSVLRTKQKYICVSRPRRFGKSMAADMLAAYYSRGNSGKLFDGLKISEDESYLEHLNQYDTIFLNMQEFLSRTNHMESMLALLKKFVLRDLLSCYPDVDYFNKNDLIASMQDIYQAKKIPFVLIIDEWDCIFREYKDYTKAQKKYLDFLRDLLKDKGYIYLAYMTGILPIKKYGTHSALNMFSEFSMTNPRQLARFAGFTEDEVQKLAKEYHRSMPDLKEWYNGYRFEGTGAVYSPKSVVEAVLSGICDVYWNKTETFEALRDYIDMNFEGLKDNVLSMLAGETVPVNTERFSNDMVTFADKDDVLTLLIHLGYLGYDFREQSVFIPNGEIRREFVNAVSSADWGEVSKALKFSADTLRAVWEKRASQVAVAMEQAHFETAYIQYNDENALSYTISLALYAARNYYTLHREFPGGKGVADMVFLPKKNFPDKPALLVELKWNKSTEGAIAQIKERKYCDSLKDYHGRLLLVGVNYDKKTKKHECIIEEA